MPQGERSGDRTAEARRLDHAAIERLADDLLPALVAKLGATGLGELEVREGAWKVRLRMPERRARRSAGRGAGDGGRAAEPGTAASAGHGHGAAATVVHVATAAADATRPASRQSEHGAQRTGDGDDDPRPTAPRRAIATSPAVGYFRPLPSASSGGRVRTGDRVGVVDVLGVAHEVLAPVDGRLGATLVEAGEPVEYGQEIVEIELLPNGSAGRHGTPAAEVPGPAMSASGDVTAADASAAEESAADGAAVDLTAVDVTAADAPAPGAAR